MKKLMIAAVAGLALIATSTQVFADGDDAGHFLLGMVVGSVLAPRAPVYQAYVPPATVTVVPGGYYAYRYRPYGYYGHRVYPRAYRHEWRERAWRRHEWREHARRGHDRGGYRWRHRDH